MVYNGSDLHSVRRFMMTGLKYEVTYRFNLYGLNVVGSSRHLRGVYTVHPRRAIDKSYVLWDISTATNTTQQQHQQTLVSIAGTLTSVIVQGVHPVTGSILYIHTYIREQRKGQDLTQELYI